MVIIDVNDVELAELVEGVVGVISGHNQEIMGHVQGSECHSIRSFDRFLILWRYYINEKNLLNGLNYSHENKNYITSGSPSPSRLRTRPEPSFSGTRRTGSSSRSGSPLPRVLQRQLLPRCLLLTQLLEVVPHFFVRLH